MYSRDPFDADGQEAGAAGDEPPAPVIRLRPIRTMVISPDFACALSKWGWTQDLRAGVELAYREGNPRCAGGLPHHPCGLPHRSTWQRMAGPLLRRP